MKGCGKAHVWWQSGGGNRSGCSALIPIWRFGGGDFDRMAPCMALVVGEGWEKRFTSSLCCLESSRGHRHRVCEHFCRFAVSVVKCFAEGQENSGNF